MPDIKNNWIVVAQADGEHKPGEQTGAHSGAGAAEHGGETHATVGHESGGHGEHGTTNPLTHHSPFEFSISGLVVAGILVALSIAATAKMAKIPRNKLQTIMESAVEFINNFCEQNIGPGGRRFAPLIGTLFLFILLSNLLGALPLIFKAEGPGQVGPIFNFLIGPTANLSMNFAMALIVFFTFQVVALREQGLVGRLKHLAGPVPFAAPLIFVLEVISELIRPVSLSFRLFGNIFGEEMMVAAIIGLVAMLPAPFGWLPLHLPLVLFGLLTAVVQAGVFCLLSCIYLRMAQSHDDHGSHAHDEAHSEHGDSAHPAPAH